MSTVISNVHASQVNWSQSELAPLHTFLLQQSAPANTWPQLEYVDAVALPNPYDFLLTQPLMTQAISQYYQRTPKVRTPLYTFYLPDQGSFYRAIIMIVDHNKQRDDALAADKIGQSTITELGMITMNFTALPKTVIDGVLHSQIPFGALLVESGIKTHSIKTHYFKITCNALLAQYLQCPLNTTLYGRTNTLVREDNQQWVARVVEIPRGRV